MGGLETKRTKEKVVVRDGYALMSKQYASSANRVLPGEGLRIERRGNEQVKLRPSASQKGFSRLHAMSGTIERDAR